MQMTMRWYGPDDPVTPSHKRIYFVHARNLKIEGIRRQTALD